MENGIRRCPGKPFKWSLILFFLFFNLCLLSYTEAFTLKVVDPNGNPVKGERQLGSLFFLMTTT
jgi:hypothetical protein